MVWIDSDGINPWGPKVAAITMADGDTASIFQAKAGNGDIHSQAGREGADADAILAAQRGSRQSVNTIGPKLPSYFGSVAPWNGRGTSVCVGRRQLGVSPH